MGGAVKKIPGVKNVVKIIDKVVPNEIKPILPYVASFYGGPALSSMFAGSAAGGLGALIANNPTLTKALISGTTRGLIDDDASLKEVATAGILAAAPDLLSKGLGNLASSGTVPGIGPTQTPMSGFDKAIQGVKNIAGQAGSAIEGAGALKTIGAQASGDVSMSAIEAAKLAQEEYERQNRDFQNFSGQQLADFSAGRRAAILASMGRAGFGEDVINSTLSQLGLRNGGRVGFEMGGDVSPTDSDEEGMGGVIYYDEEGKPISQKEAMRIFNEQAEEEYRQKNNKAMGGIINLMGGGMPSMEMDYRGGGFIPVGAKEKADDVPARLSKNEFVMTADAVRAAGGGSVNEGARRMYELMNNLEARA